MKALSLRQPWAALVVHFGKHIENRRWNTSFRGEFLIHAAKGMTNREFEEAMDFAFELIGDKCPTEAQLRSMLMFGGIVGRANLVDVIPPRSMFYPSGVERGWHMPEQYGFVLESVAPLTFEPMRGELGFFEVRKVANV